MVHKYFLSDPARRVNYRAHLHSGCCQIIKQLRQTVTLSLPSLALPLGSRALHYNDQSGNEEDRACSLSRPSRSPFLSISLALSHSSDVQFTVLPHLHQRCEYSKHSRADKSARTRRYYDHLFLLRIPLSRNQTLARLFGSLLVHLPLRRMRNSACTSPLAGVFSASVT